MKNSWEYNNLALRKISICAASLILLSSPIWACSIPVFQYALTRWHSDPYEVFVFHRDGLSLEEQSRIDRLQNAMTGHNSHANIIVETIDLARSQNDAMRQIWQAQGIPKLPWMVVRSPGASAFVWSGRFTANAVEMLLDSPVRQEIARRILDDDVAVWILLESGISPRDDAAVSLLEKQLKKLEGKLKIIDPQGSTIDRQTSFSMIRLSRNDPNEQIFVQMLLHTEWDLKDFAKAKPMAFPIFGRGRVLYALIGDGINEENIERTCSFLVGWCSCEVKALNPGVDLLMSVNWENQIDEQLVRYVSSELSGYDETPMDSGTSAYTETSGNLKRNILIAVSIQIIIVLIAIFVILWRRKLIDYLRR